jgi:hypothetical protein
VASIGWQGIAIAVTTAILVTGCAGVVLLAHDLLQETMGQPVSRELPHTHPSSHRRIARSQPNAAQATDTGAHTQAEMKFLVLLQGWREGLSDIQILEEAFPEECPCEGNSQAYLLGSYEHSTICACIHDSDSGMPPRVSLYPAE